MNNNIQTYSDINDMYMQGKGDSLVTDTDVLVQSLRTIFRVDKKTRLFNRSFGLGLDNYIGELITEDIVSNIQFDIQNKLPSLEPRIKLRKHTVEVTPDPDANAVLIVFTYVVEATGKDQVFQTIIEL